MTLDKALRVIIVAIFLVMVNTYQPEHVRDNKYAVYFKNASAVTWDVALEVCSEISETGSLFMVSNMSVDSAWLAARINAEYDSNGASDFWIGLESISKYGPLLWLDGSDLEAHDEIVEVRGFQDESHLFAKVTPMGSGKIAYIFTPLNETNYGYFCEYYEE